MTSTVPYVFCDADGVLNVCAKPYLDAWGDLTAHKVTVSEGGGLATRVTVRLSARMGAALAAAGGDLRWLTTWEKHANRHIGPKVGIDHRPVLWREGRYDRAVCESANWKAAAICWQLQTDPRPFVWIDDDAHTPAAVEAVTTAAGAAGVDMLVVTTRECEGLAHSHVDEIAAFVAAHSR